MTKEAVSISYSGVAISYDEAANRWGFTLRGRDRSAESLAAAKEAIDKPAPKKQFARVKAIKIGNGGEFAYGEVTSVAENGYVWFTSPEGREKVSTFNIRKDTKHNRAIAARIEALDKKAEKMYEDADALRYRMAELNIKSPE